VIVGDADRALHRREAISAGRGERDEDGGKERTWRVSRSIAIELLSVRFPLSPLLPAVRFP
jgi:hypothetical protein